MIFAAWLGAGLLGVLLAVLLVRRRRRRHVAREVAVALAAPTPVAQPSTQAASLAAQLARALSEVRGRARSPLWRGRGDALPRYLVLGDAASGKRSVIAGSGLRFVPGAARGACWLAEEALLVCVSTPPHAERTAQDDWAASLALLRRARPRRPLDGVLACIDVAVLQSGDAAAREAAAEALRLRLRSLVESAGVRPPVYVLLTKCDRLPGFSETFGALAGGEQRRPWGFSLPARDDGVVAEEVARRFARLVQVVERRAITRMTVPQTLEACTAIYALPAALAALEAPLRELLALAFTRDAPLLRGVFFTGVAAQVAGTRDADVLAPDRATLSAPERLFVRELFARVVLPDLGLAPLSAKRAARQQRTARAATLGLGLLVALFACVELRAYVHNRRLLDGLQHALGAARAPTAVLRRQPALLEPLRASVRTFETYARTGVPAALGLGLYPGELLRGEAELLFAAIVRNTWVAPHVQRIAEELAAPAPLEARAGRSESAEHARIYALLERYLRWTRDDGPAPPRGAESAAWLLDGLADGQSSAPRAHVSTYLTLLAVRPGLALARDVRTVAEARARLREMPAASLAVDRIEAELAPHGAALTLEALLGAAGTPLQAPPRIAYAFTRRGWEAHARALLEAPSDALLGESWVLGEASPGTVDAARAARICALRAAYFARYVESWRELLASVRVAPLRDAGQALAALQALTRGQPPPLERLASEVARNAQLDPPARAAEQANDGLLERLKQSLGSTAHAASLPAQVHACDAEETRGPASVRAALGGFARFGAGEASSSEAAAPPAVTASRLYHEQLAYVRDAMQAHQLEPGDGEPLLARLAAAEGSVRTLIDAQEVGWRPRFEALLWPPLRAARSTSSGDLARQRAASWCATVVLPFQHGLAGRYPFVRTGQDASLADLSAFYRPGQGALWSSYDALLARDVPQTGDRFARRAGSPLARRYPADLPAFLERSQAIARALFPDPLGPARVAFDVRVRPTAEVASIVLEVDGQRVDFHNGPERWLPLRWPGEGAARGASLRVRGVGIDETIAQEGEWGIFRLIESGMVSANAAEGFFSVRFRLRTQRDVVIDLRPARATHPLVGASGRPLEVFRASAVEPPRELAEGVRVCR